MNHVSKILRGVFAVRNGQVHAVIRRYNFLFASGHWVNHLVIGSFAVRLVFVSIVYGKIPVYIRFLPSVLYRNIITITPPEEMVGQKTFVLRMELFNIID